jgi:hypothetical protein
MKKISSSAVALLATIGAFTITSIASAVDM